MQKIHLNRIFELLQGEVPLPPGNILRCMLVKLKNTTPQHFFLNEEVELTTSETQTLKKWIEEFSQQKPLSKILEEKEFWSLNFITNIHTLDPRPDSETLIEQVFSHIPNRNKAYKILDLGTGTGCLLITLLCEFSNSHGVGIDISYEALCIAEQNSTQHKVSPRCKFLQSNWFDNIQGTFDIIIANPPYIQNNYPLEKSVVLYDPHTALFGGEDGLDAYRGILKDLKRFCTNETLCFFEIGFDQMQTVSELIKQHELQIVGTYQDLGKNDRVIVFRS